MTTLLSIVPGHSKVCQNSPNTLHGACKFALLTATYHKSLLEEVLVLLLRNDNHNTRRYHCSDVSH